MRKGFALPLILAIFVVSVLAAGGGYFLYQNKTSTKPKLETGSQPSPTSSPLLSKSTQTNSPDPTQSPITRAKETELRKYFKTNSGISVALISYENDPKYLNQKEIAISEIEQYAKEHKQKVDQTSIDELNSKRKIKVRVGFKSEINSAATYNPARFSLKDANNTKYNTYFNDPLGIYSVYPNEATEYDLYYFVPGEAQNFKMIYENVEIAFSL